MKPYRLPIKTTPPRPKRQPLTGTGHLYTRESKRAPLTFEVWAGTKRDHVTVVARAATKAAGVELFERIKATPVKGRGLALVRLTRNGTYAQVKSFAK